jgi:hypothetical protein
MEHALLSARRLIRRTPAWDDLGEDGPELLYAAGPGVAHQA